MTVEKDAENVPKDLFKNVTYYIVGDISDHVMRLLNAGGAKRDTYLSEMVSHVIADSTEPDEYSEAKELFELPGVTSDWVLLSVKCGRLLDKELFALEGRLFSGVVACPSQLDTSDANSLWSMIVFNGGRCVKTLNASVTHLIVSEAKGAKYEEALKHEDKIHVVTPDWVADSIKKECKQDEAMYHPKHLLPPKPPTPPRLPTPPVRQPPPILPSLEIRDPLSDMHFSSLHVPQHEHMDVSPTSLLPHSPSAQLLRRKSSSDELSRGSSRPETPSSAKEALARMVSNRLQASNKSQESPEARIPPLPGMPPSSGQLPIPPMSHGMPPHGPPQPPLPPHSMGMPLEAMQQLLQHQHQQQMQHQQQQHLHPQHPHLPQHHPQHPQHHLQQQQQHPPQHMQHQHPPHLQLQQQQQQHLQQPPQHPPMPQQHPLQHLQQQQHQQQQMQQPPHMPMPDMPPGGRMLRNITNDSPTGAVPPRPPTTKISQMLGMGLPRPPGPPGPPGPLYPTPSLAQQHMQPMVPQYVGHEQTENIPPELCMLGCVFYITDYQKKLGPSEIDTWKQVIEQHGGQVDGSYSSRITHLLCINQHSDVFDLAKKDHKRLVTAFWLNDCLLEKKMVPPWQALHLPLIFDENNKPCTDQVISITNFAGEERHRVRQMINTLGAKYTGYLAHSNTVLVCKKPEGTKYERAKDWRMPVVNISWLSDLLLGNMEALRLPVHQRYMQSLTHNELHMELRHVTHLMMGWRSPLKINKEALKKISAFKARPSPLLSGDKHKTSTEGDEVEDSQAKRQKMEDCINGVTGYPRVLFTGFSPTVTKRLKAAVQQLGGVVVESARHCTHLVMPCLMRTMKFFVAISVCKYVLNKSWLEESLAQSKFLEEHRYFLQDSKGEGELGCSLKETVTRARQQALFQSLTFFITPSVTPPPCDLKEIIDAAGGVLVKRRPSAKDIATMVDEKGHPTFVVISCSNDFPLCRDLIDRKIALFDVELVLAGVTRQMIDFDTHRLYVR